MRRQRKARWIIGCVSAGLFLGITLSLDGLAPVDQWVYGWISLLISPGMTLFMQAMTSLATPLLLLALSIPLILWMPRKEYRVPLIFNLMMSILLNLSLKSYFMRTRPTEVMRLTVESGYSFPSGHTMAAVCFYGFLFWLVCGGTLVKRTKTLWSAVLFLVIFFAGVSRIYLGAHYFTDVLAGVCVSILYLVLYTALIDNYFTHGENVHLRARHPERASLLSSFRFALEGIAEGLRTERNMVIHVGIMALVIVFGALLALSPLEWMLCVLLFGLVFMAELFNTAVETVVNMVTEDYHSRAKRAKDMAAGAVLVASVTAAVIGALIFIPKVLAVVRTGFHF